MSNKTFALIMKNGVKVKTIEELRDNFNLNNAIESFKDGTLIEWLEDRFYDDEAEAIAQIKLDDKNFAKKICAALNVDFDDLEFTIRIKEKREFLKSKTDDENIINNASITVLNQDDLANLVKMDYKKNLSLR